MEKNKISAKIVADSKDHRGNRITTFVLTYPRFIHAELMTHRLFSRNAASSRAIPFKKMVQMIEDDPFIPIAWQKDHKGMQGSEYFTDQYDKSIRNASWLRAKDAAILETKHMHLNGVTKQLCNRLLEPYQWYTVLVTATEFDNFFELRCPKYYYEPEEKYFKSKKDFSDYWFENFGSGIEEAIEGDPTIFWLELSKSGAEIHIQALAEAMWDARNESTPKELKAGEWHIPFGDKINVSSSTKPISDFIDNLKIKIATARAARLSYMTFDGEIDYKKDIALHDQLLTSKHMSPFEHCARVMDENEYVNSIKSCQTDNKVEISYGWCNNIRGFIQYRYLAEHGKTDTNN